MIYFTEPEQFKPSFQAGGCFVEYNGKFLVLLRQDHKPQGNTWCIPGGKIDTGEMPLEAIKRELLEETGLNINSDLINLTKTVFVKVPEYDFVYRIFHHKTNKPVKIILETNAHKDYRWVTPAESLALPHIHNFDSCVKIQYP